MPGLDSGLYWETAGLTAGRKAAPAAVSHKKSVRFNDKIEEFKKVKPFKDDDPVEAGDQDNGAAVAAELFGERASDDGASVDEMSNQGLFIQHQQQLQQQDDHIELLAQSVSRQHGLSLDINHELGEQNILLNDLESQLDLNQRNLSRGQKRLEKFSKTAKEHGQLITIITLFVILVLLLVILK